MFLTETEKKDISKIFYFFINHKKIFLLVTIIGAVLGALVTFFIPPKFSAKSVIFAINYAELAKNPANMPFGLDIHADQLIQVLISNRLKDSVIQHFNLLKYYEIDKKMPDWREQIYTHWNSDIKIQKTRFLSIEIEVKTKQAQLSADIANEIVVYADKIYNEMLDEQELTVMRTATSNYETQYQEILQMNDSINQLIQQKKDTFIIRILKNNISSKMQILNDETKKQYLLAKSRLEKKTQVLSIVDRAVPAGRKCSPSFSLNILMGATLGLVFTIIGKLLVLFAEKYNLWH